MTRLSIVIVTYHSRAEIDDCLRALGDAPPRTTYEVTIVDNASADGTAEHVRRHWPAVRLVEAGRNVGFAAGTNLGIRQGSSELVLILNPDTRVTPGAIDRLVAVLDARPDVAIAGPRITDGEGRAELSFGRMMSPVNELRQKLLVVGNDHRLPVVSGIVARMTRRSRDVDWVSGACLLSRRTDLDAAGLFDERFFMYTEDVDLCASVRAKGRRVRFVAEAEVLHLRGRSARADPGATRAAYRRSHLAFYAKHHPAWVPLLRAYVTLLDRGDGT